MTTKKTICKSDSVMKDMSLPLRRCVLTVLKAHSLQSQNSSGTPKNLRYFRGPRPSGLRPCSCKRSELARGPQKVIDFLGWQSVTKTPRFAPETHPSLHLLCCSLLFLLLTAYCLLPTAVIAAEKWQGVDESVVGKYAKEHGREAARPLIDIEQGDLPLFMFLLAGVAGGFAAGYYWRKLTEPNALKKEDRKE